MARGSTSAIDLRPVPQRKPLAVKRLSIYLYNGENLGMLAAILRLCSQSIEDVELVLREGSETQKEVLKTPAPAIGFGIHPLPKLKKLYIWKEWSQSQFKQGEKSTIMNLMEAIPTNCNFQILYDNPRWDVPKSKPPWHKRLQANKQAPINNEVR